ncbi:type 1 glutamine amidotransferase domain-containing protein [Halomonas sp. WWR20]
MAQQLQGKRVAILATNGFEEVELTAPRDALREAGAEVHIVSPEKDTIKAWDKTDWSDSYQVDKSLDEARPSDYHALVLPGGQINPDILRMDDKAVAFARAFFEDHKPVGAICHGPWLLINAGVVEGRTMTSFPSVSLDLKNAGANWVDQEVVVDHGLVTSRKPDDLKAFCAKLVEEICEGRHTEQHA